MTDEAQWWARLSEPTRRHLAGDPFGEVPAPMWSEILRAGGSVVGTYWPSVQPGPDGFRLPDRLAAFVKDQPSAEADA